MGKPERRDLAGQKGSGVGASKSPFQGNDVSPESPRKQRLPDVIAQEQKGQRSKGRGEEAGDVEGGTARRRERWIPCKTWKLRVRQSKAALNARLSSEAETKRKS